MPAPLPPPLSALPPSSSLHLGFRFGVFFMRGLLPNPLDIRFKKVKGLSATVRTMAVREGGQNLYAQKLPVAVEYENLILERGMVVGSLLNIEFEEAMSQFQFKPSNVLVTLFNDLALPVSAWMFRNAYPVKWSTSDLDAAERSLVIDTLELSYTQMQIMRI